MNTNAKHTPGPWKHVPRARDGHADIIQHKGNPFIQVGAPWAESPVIDYPHENEQTANARMVAAAPDLLYALKEAKSMLETAKGYFPKSIQNRDRFSLLNVLANAVDPAIAKAEGGAQ